MNAVTTIRQLAAEAVRKVTIEGKADLIEAMDVFRKAARKREDYALLERELVTKGVECAVKVAMDDARKLVKKGDLSPEERERFDEQNRNIEDTD